MSIFFDNKRGGLQLPAHKIVPGHARLGIRHGSIACTTGLANRVADSVSCIASTGCPQSLARTRDRA
jgi:hypothetical protein